MMVHSGTLSADSDGGEVIRNRNSFYLCFQSSSSILYLFGSDNDSRGINDNDNNTVSNSCTNFSPNYSYKEHILFDIFNSTIMAFFSNLPADISSLKWHCGWYLVQIYFLVISQETQEDNIDSQTEENPTAVPSEVAQHQSSSNVPLSVSVANETAFSEIWYAAFA